MEFEFEGYNVYYETYGSGENLIVLNGIMMSTASWKNFIENFSHSNRLILVDFIDQGKSSNGKKGYDHSLQVRLLKALTDRFEGDFTVMGISYGGEIALQYALEYPKRVKKLILANTAARTSEWLKEEGHRWNKAAEAFNGRLYYETTIPIIYSENFKQKYSDWMAAREDFLCNYFEDRNVIDRLVRLTDSSENYDVTERLNEVKCPTLIISGSEDYLIPPPEQKLLHEGISGSEWVTINGCGHASMYEEAALFSALVLGFANRKQDKIQI